MTTSIPAARASLRRIPHHRTQAVLLLPRKAPFRVFSNHLPRGRIPRSPLYGILLVSRLRAARVARDPCLRKLSLPWEQMDRVRPSHLYHRKQNVPRRMCYKRWHPWQIVCVRRISMRSAAKNSSGQMASFAGLSSKTESRV